ncbi:hypothetical protein SAMN02745687_02122 [Lachnospiraceae bacterium NK3A20]|nr:hypothetical protein SAMN02745687_02122 [Lachnospiraceae bacterium NK3A20]
MGVVIGILMLLIMVIFSFVAMTVEAILFYMPYALGAALSAMAFALVPGVQGWIPGHPWLCFLSVLAMMEVLIAIFMHIRQLARPFIALCCAVFVGFAGAIVFDSLTADSVGYCIFMTVVFEAVAFLIIGINQRNIQETVSRRNLFCSILAGIMYGLSVMILVNAPADILWKHYLVSTGVNKGSYEFILNTACVILGVLTMAMTIVLDRQSGSGLRED